MSEQFTDAAPGAASLSGVRPIRDLDVSAAPSTRGQDAAHSAVSDHTGPPWLGYDEGLTRRESEIIALIAQGLSNQQIADQTFLSINSVKSYIRTAYRKMEVVSRSQAVLWGVRHGFVPTGAPSVYADNVRPFRRPVRPSSPVGDRA